MTTSNTTIAPIKDVAQSSILKTSDKYLSYVINGIEIFARQSDGYVYATAMCRAAGKHWKNYYQNKETKRYLAIVSQEAGIPAAYNSQETQIRVSKKDAENQSTKEMRISYRENHSGAKFLIEQVKGRYNKQGTWVHPDVAQHLARWLSPEIDYAVTQIVKSWMSGKSCTIEPPIQESLPATPRNTITTVITMEPGKPPRSCTYEGKVMLIPEDEYHDLSKYLTDSFHAHYMDVMNKLSDYMLKNLSINNPDKAREVVTDLRNIGMRV